MRVPGSSLPVTRLRLAAAPPAETVVPAPLRIGPPIAPSVPVRLASGGDEPRGWPRVQADSTTTTPTATHRFGLIPDLAGHGENGCYPPPAVCSDWCQTRV